MPLRRGAVQVGDDRDFSPGTLNTLQQSAKKLCFFADCCNFTTTSTVVPHKKHLYMSPEVYNRCVEEHADRLYRFVLKNVRDEDKAADIVQDAYEKMWRYREGVQDDKAKSYLFTTAYHVMIDALKREQRMTRPERGLPDEGCSGGQYSDLNEILHAALERLPADQKMVILLRDYEGYSYEEIEQITGLSQSQVKVYIYRARVFLKKYIGQPELVV